MEEGSCWSNIVGKGSILLKTQAGIFIKLAKLMRFTSVSRTSGLEMLMDGFVGGWPALWGVP